MNTYIGIDLGGTKLLVGEVTEAGEVLRTRSYPTGALTQQQAMDLICSALDAFLPECSPAVQALGLGLVGRIDSEKGLWLEISGGTGRQRFQSARCFPSAIPCPPSRITMCAAPSRRSCASARAGASGI